MSPLEPPASPAPAPGPPGSPTVAALRSLQQALEAARPAAGSVAGGNWRWQVRQRLVALRGALVHEVALAGAAGETLRERHRLVTRTGLLADQALQTDVDALCVELRRLVGEVHDHVQRAGGGPGGAAP